MADELEAELSALEDAAPDIVEVDESGQEYGPGNPPPEADEGKPGAKAKDEAPADEWKPPSKEHWENLEKARRDDRNALREQRRQNQLYEQNLQRMQERFEAFQQQQIMQRIQAPPPDPYENPDAARQWQAQQQQLQQQLFLAEQQRAQQIRAQQQEVRQFEALYADVEDYEGAFTAKNPDYHEATDYLLKAQQTLLEQAGFPPQVAQAQVSQWSKAVAQQAIMAGRDPAEWAYNQAKAIGYQPKNGQTQSAAAAAEKLAAIKAGQQAAQTLSGGGAGAKGGTSLKQIASLEGAAFDSAMDKYLNDAIRGR